MILPLEHLVGQSKWCQQDGEGSRYRRPGLLRDLAAGNSLPGDCQRVCPLERDIGEKSRCTEIQNGKDD